MKDEGSLGSCLLNCNLALPLNRSDLEEDDPKEDEQLSLDPILDDPTTGCSVRKRNGEGTSLPRNLRGVRRRKGVPRRSPFY